MVSYTLKQFKSALNIRKTPDHWFWEKYGLNVYNGCEHGCIYCDSRSAKYHLPSNFSEEIIVKENIAQTLENQIGRSRKILPDIVGLSGASDPYHHAESIYSHTRQCLQILKKWKFPVHVITKSDMVLRDLDVIAEIGKQNWSCVSVTITTSNEQMAGFLEPGAPSTEKRFKIFEEIKKKSSHIQCGVLLMPVIPFLTDDEKNLEDIIIKAKSSGADYVVFGSGLTLRNVQALFYLNQIKAKMPHLISKYEQLYQFQYSEDNYSGGYTPLNEYALRLNKVLVSLCHKHNMSLRIKRFIPSDFRKLSYSLSEHFFNEAYNMQISGAGAKNLYLLATSLQNLKVSLLEIYQNNLWDRLQGLDATLQEFITCEMRSFYGNIETHKQLGLF